MNEQLRLGAPNTGDPGSIPGWGPRSPKVKVKLLSCVQLFATPRIGAHQASPSMRFSRQEYWSGAPFSSPGRPHVPQLNTLHAVSKDSTGRNKGQRSHVPQLRPRAVTKINTDI